MLRRDSKLGEQNLLFNGEADSLRWFLLPSEALKLVDAKDGETSLLERKSPFSPVVYRHRDDSPPSKKDQSEQDCNPSSPPSVISSSASNEANSVNLVNELVSSNSLVSPLDAPIPSIPIYSNSKKKRRKGEAEKKSVGMKVDREENSSATTVTSTTNGAALNGTIMNGLTSIDNGPYAKIDGDENIDDSVDMELVKSNDAKSDESGSKVPESSAMICTTGACPRLLNFKEGGNGRRRQITQLPPTVKPKWFSPGRKLYKPTAEAIEVLALDNCT